MKRRRITNLEHDAQRRQKAPLLLWHLDLHISFSWVTKYINTRFKSRSLAICTPPTHTHTRTHAHTHTRTHAHTHARTHTHMLHIHTALTLAFRMGFGNGRGIWHLVFDPWSSLLLSVLVMSDESSQMGGFFLFFSFGALQTVVMGVVSRRLPLSYIGLLQDSLQTVNAEEVSRAGRQPTGVLRLRHVSSCADRYVSPHHSTWAWHTLTDTPTQTCGWALQTHTHIITRFSTHNYSYLCMCVLLEAHILYLHDGLFRLCLTCCL